MRSLAFASIFAASVSAAEMEVAFIRWASQHGKSYNSLADYQFRFEQFSKTHAALERLNQQNGTSTVRHNQFSDMTEEEFAQFANYKPSEKTMMSLRNPVILSTEDLPDSINWVELGGVNPVQNQGTCGSCWAFSAIASMEGQHFATSKELLKLSEQECVDCDPESFGCSGGWQDNCMWFVYDYGGIQLEADYPYVFGSNTANKECPAPYGGPVQVKGVNPVKSYKQDQLMAAIAQGVTSVTIESASEVFRFYDGGVITDVSCGTSLDHAVAAVGYGTDENGVDYYLIRNSWGSEWGDHGYVKIGRNGDGYGICGVQEISVWATTN